MGALRSVALAVALVTGVAPAHAQDVRLDYEALVPGCPSERELRDAVAIRLGRDAVRDDAERTVRVRIDRRGPALVARVELLDGSGAPVRRRDLTDVARCAELAEMLVLAISIAIDPERALGVVSPGAESAPEPELVVAEPAIAAPSAPSAPTPIGGTRSTERDGQEVAPTPEPAALVLSTSIAIYGLVGFSPSPTAGGAVDLRARYDAVSITLGSYGELPTSADTPSGTAVSFRAGGLAMPCAHVDAFAFCAPVQFGAIVGHAEDVSSSRQASAVFVALGLRAEVEVRFGPLALGGYLEVLATPTPTELRIDGEPAWSTGALAGALGARLRVELGSLEP